MDKIKHFLICIVYSQTDQFTVLVKDCKDIKEAKKRARKEYPGAVQLWTDGEVLCILEK